MMATLRARRGLAVCAGLLFCLAPAVATGQRGPGPGPSGGQGLTGLTVFETDDFSGSGICAMCHSRLTDEAANDVSNDALWRSTMMANAAKDPFWQAKISSEVDRNPHVRSTIEEKCSRCHTGMARYQAITDDTAVEVLVPGFLDPSHYLHEAAMDGVSCALCHQFQPDGLGTSASFTGSYVIDTSSFPPDRSIFGPYQAPFGNPMRQAAGFSPAAGLQIQVSGHCGSCHTLYTPALDSGGSYVGEFPEQTTYLEWEHSGRGETCQDCHLPLAAGAVVISNRPPNLGGREPFWKHYFVGGNSIMVGMLKSNAAALGVTAAPGDIDNTLARTVEQLETATAFLAGDASRSGELLTVTVNVVNLTGHKLPSGLPSRRAWLHLLVSDQSGGVVFESGRPLAGGRIEGNDAEDPDPASPPYEPHYDTAITSPDQVQIYEPIMLNTDGQVTYTLLRASSYAKDNRLLPSGFEKDTAHSDIAVYGAASGDSDFIGGSDRTAYEIGVGGLSGPLHVSAELLYQTLSAPFVDDLATTDTDLVVRFMGMYGTTDNQPVTLSRVQWTVP